MIVISNEKTLMDKRKRKRQHARHRYFRWLRFGLILILVIPLGIMAFYTDFGLVGDSIAYTVLISAAVYLTQQFITAVITAYSDDTKSSISER